MFARPFATLLLSPPWLFPRSLRNSAALSKASFATLRARCFPEPPSRPNPTSAPWLRPPLIRSARFRFPALPPGNYKVTANLQGFVSREVVDVHIALGQVKKVDFSLPVVGRDRDGAGDRDHADGRRAPERASDQHPRRAGRVAAARPRLHDAGDAGPRRQPGIEAWWHLDRRRQRRREPLHHRRHRDDQSADRPLGQEPDRRLRRGSPGQVERLHGRVRRRPRRRHQRGHQERHQRVQRHGALQLPGQLDGRQPPADAAPEPDQLRHRRIHHLSRRHEHPHTNRASPSAVRSSGTACGSSAPTCRR